MSLPDPMAALVDYLKADSAVSALVSDRVYITRIPVSQTPNMPKAAIVLTKSGGFGTASYSGLYNQRIDVRTYGATVKEASQVQLALMQALIALERQVRKSAVLYRVINVGGAFQLEEPDTHWPFEFSTWELQSNLNGVN